MLSGPVHFSDVIIEKFTKMDLNGQKLNHVFVFGLQFWSEVLWVASVGPSFVSTPLPSVGERRRLVLPLPCSVLQPHLVDSPPLLVTERMACICVIVLWSQYLI